jgi:hypothetical protein
VTVRSRSNAPDRITNRTGTDWSRASTSTQIQRPQFLIRTKRYQRIP